MGPWSEIAALAARQHGVVTREQCLAAGASASTLADHARRFGWRTVQRGVFALPGTADTFAQRATAALLAVGAPVRLTAGAALHALGVLEARPADVTLLVPHRRTVTPRPGVEIVRTERFDALGRLTRGPLTLVRPPRALADHARTVAPVPLARLMGRACGLRHAHLSALSEELDARERFPGRAAYGRALAMLRGELTHSGAERAARRHARAAGIDVWPRPYPVEHAGRIVAEIDLAVPSLRYGAEIDGPHHDLPEQVAADKQRDRLLRRLGWRIDRFPVELIEHDPERFIRELRAAILALESSASIAP